MNDLTVLIPTFNRPQYLKRLLRYCSEMKVDYQIIIADSSSEENKKTNQKSVSLFPDLKILYLNSYPEQVFIFKKCADALNQVNAKYCIFCADDDFFIPEGINQSVDFLEENPDFTVAHGYTLSFWIDEKRRKVYWIKYNSDFSIIQNDPKQRLSEHLSHYNQATFYDVHRTDFMKMIFEETLKYIDDNRFGELLPSMLDLIYGKMKHLNVFYGARQISHNSDGRTCTTMHDFIRNGSYNRKAALFKECLALHLSKNVKTEPAEINKIIEDAMDLYLGNNYKHRLMDKIKTGLETLGASPRLYEKIRLFLKSFNTKYGFLIMKGRFTDKPAEEKEFELIRKYLIN